MAAEAQDPASLSRLHDIVQPPPVPWWPPAPGWYVVGALVLIVSAVFAWRAWRRWRANRYRRAALRELESLRLAQEVDRTAALLALPEVMKRTALAGYPREEVAPLSAAAWLRFLDRTGATDAFSKGPGRRLEPLAYEPAAAELMEPEEIEELFRVLIHWTRHHNVRRQTGALQ